jgi:hypothetical protein
MPVAPRGDRMFKGKFANTLPAWAVMSSMSAMLRVALIGTLIISHVLLSPSSKASAQEKAEEAWWLTATFTPNQTEYLSLRASDIDQSWVALSPLDMKALPKEAAGDLDWMKRDGFRFSWDGKLNEAQSTHIATGVYKARDGSTGRFLLVLEKSTSGNWRVKFLHKEAGDPGFGVLRITKSGALRRVSTHRSG